MERGEQIYEKFDHLESIRLSGRWNDGLKQKLAHSEHISGNSSGNKILITVIISLITVNVLAFSGYWIRQKTRQTEQVYKNIAGEFLISTDSSKF